MFGKKEVDLRRAENLADDLISLSHSGSYLGDKGAFLFAEGIVYHIMVLQEKYKREYVDAETMLPQDDQFEKNNDDATTSWTVGKRHIKLPNSTQQL